MHYQQLPPPPYLNRHVQYFWKLENNVHDSIPKTFAAMADGCPGIIFYQSDGSFFDHTEQKVLPGIFLYGQTTRQRQISAHGSFTALGVTLYPHALQTVFGMNAVELTDTCADVDDIYAPQGARLHEQLLNSPSTEARVALISAYLFAKISRRPGVDTTLQHVIDRVLQSQGSLPLKTLLHELNISERSLERRFKQQVGISPKLFMRICRFQASLMQLREQGHEKLSDIAFAHGYADQSHFIRAFKEFAGHSPSQYRKVIRGGAQNFPELKEHAVVEVIGSSS